MRALVTGAGGKMGLAVSYAMAKLGFEVQMFDPKPFSNGKVVNLSGSNKVAIVNNPVPLTTDVVISAAPFDTNMNIAKLCVKNNVPYCDLGGNPEISKSIQDLTNKTPVFTDLGLAPGWANIIAEHLFLKHNDSETVQTMVGGLPPEQVFGLDGFPELNWDRSFAIEGLRNEYKGLCNVVMDSEKRKRPALVGKQIVETPYGGKMEAFHTRGGSGSTVDFMLRAGVKTYNYKTLRWPGHLQLIKFLLENCNLSDSMFDHAILNASRPPHSNMVVMRFSYKKIREEEHVYWKQIKDDEDWTAMQKGTSFPAAAIAALMAKGRFDGKGALSYSDVPYREFTETLAKIDPTL